MEPTATKDNVSFSGPDPVSVPDTVSLALSSVSAAFVGTVKVGASLVFINSTVTNCVTVEKPSVTEILAFSVSDKFDDDLSDNNPRKSLW